MRVLVIGGSGLFGKKCALALLADPDVRAGGHLRPGAAGRALHASASEPYADKFKYVRGDISDLQQVLAAASANKVDRIVNWAMILSKDPMPWLNMKIGLQGMSNVFETARLLGIKRVVYASSETVYGEQKDYGDREIGEDDRLLPYPGQRLRSVQVPGRGVRRPVRRAVRHQVHGAAALHRLRPRRQGPDVRALVLRHRVAAGHRQARAPRVHRRLAVLHDPLRRGGRVHPAGPARRRRRRTPAYNLGGPAGDPARLRRRRQEVHPRRGHHLRRRARGLRAAVEGQLRPGEGGLRLHAHVRRRGGAQAHQRGAGRGGHGAD